METDVAPAGATRPPIPDGPPQRWRRLRAFVRMPLLDKLAIAPAWLMLGMSAAAIAVFPFAWLAPLFGRSFGATAFVPAADARQAARARFVHRAVGRAATIAPFRSDCLPQALAAVLLCRLLRVPTATKLGVELGGALGPLRAHAWVDSGEVRVTGGRGIARYAVVACFVRRRRA